MPPLPAKVAASKKAAAPVKSAAKRTTAAGSMPSEIVALTDDETNFPRFLFYGPPGTGKTSLAGTAPRSLFLEADRGVKSAAYRGSKAKKWKISDWDDLSKALSWLSNGGYKNFDFIILDTVSMFSDRALMGIMDDLVATKPNRTVWLVDKGEYGQNMTRIKRWMTEFCELPTGIIVLAHIQEETDHEGESVFMPLLQGKNMPQSLCRHFDVIGHMSMKIVDGKEVPRVSTKKEGKYYAKDRYNGAIGAIVDPTIPKILKRIETAPRG